MSISHARDKFMNKLMTRVFNVYEETDRAIPDDGPLFRPYAEGRRYSLAHYNIVIPDLPKPHRFLGCAVLVGRPGALVFDIDHAVASSPRRTATLALGTAATAPEGFHVYDTRTDCHLRPDGSYMSFGKELAITGEFPDYHIVINRGGLLIEIDATCTEQITTFISSRIYDHIGFPARYRGTLSWEGDSQPIEGVLSFEHARGTTLTGFIDRPVAPPLKLQWNFFTYQVIKIKPDTLLMLVETAAWGRRMITSAYLKQVEGASKRWVRGVELEVLSQHDELHVAPDGFRMQTPCQFRWRIREPDGAVITQLDCTTDTELIYGLGRGWLGGYRFTGHHEGEPVSGNGYLEWVDLPYGEKR